MKSGAVSVSHPDGHVSHFQMRTSTTTKLTSGTHTPPSGRSVREQTFVARGRFESKLRLARLSDDAKYWMGSTPASTEVGYGVLPAGKFANFPKTIT